MRSPYTCLAQQAPRCFLLLFCALLSWMPQTVFAQDREAYERELRTLYAEGKTFAEKQEYKQALIKFKAALGLFDQMKVVSKDDVEKKALFQRRKMLLYTIGRTYQYDKQWSNAYKYYRDCLKEDPDAKVKQLIQQHLQTIQPHTTGEIEIESAPSQATVQLRDEWGQIITGQTPFKRKVPAGAYALTLQKDGYTPVIKTIQLRNGATLQTQYNLSSARSTFSLQSSPSGAQVKITGLNGQEYTGTTPFQQALPPGRYEISLNLAQHQEKRFFVTLNMGSDLSRQETLMRVGTGAAPPLRTNQPTHADEHLFEQRRKHLQQMKTYATTANTLGFVSGASFLACTVTWIVGNAKVSEFNNKAGDYTFNGSAQENYDTANSSQGLRAATYVFLGLSIAAAVTAISFAVMVAAAPPPKASVPQNASSAPEKQTLYSVR